MNLSRLAAAAFAAALGLGSVAEAQTVSAPTLDSATLRARLAKSWAAQDKPLPKDRATLDAWYRQEDWGRLGRRLGSAATAQEVLLDMNWEQSKIIDGAGLFLTYIYMKDAWRMGVAAPASIGDRIKQTAGAQFLYILALVRIDGQACADPSAPAARRAQLVAQSRDLIGFIGGLPKADRARMGEVALAVEAATASARGHDDFLCSGGLDQKAWALKLQGETPMSSTSGGPGTHRLYVLAPQAGYRPPYLSADKAGPKTAQARAGMAAYLNHYLMLTDVPGDAGARSDSPR